MKNKLRYLILQLGALLFSNRESKILFYHDIHDKNIYTEMTTALSLFKLHIKTIKEEGYGIVSEITKKNNQIKLQFDDGYRGIYDCLAYLIKEQIAVEIFIITSKIGQANYLNEEQIKELVKSNFIKISSHSHSHIELNKINKNSLVKELTLSKSILEKLSGQTIDSICYPLGAFSLQVIQECQSANYNYQYCSLAGSFYNNPFKDVYRRNLVQFSHTEELKLILKGANSIFNKLYFAKHFSK